MCIIAAFGIPWHIIVYADIREAASGFFCRLAQHRMFFSKPDHLFREFVHLAVLFPAAPVQPGGDVVLAVRIIISKLRITKFISRQKHDRAVAAHQCRKRVFAHTEPQRVYRRIVCLAFHATVPAAVVALSVLVVPAVFFIVLCVIGIHIIKRKSVMAVYEIDGSVFSTVFGVVDVF